MGDGEGHKWEHVPLNRITLLATSLLFIVLPLSSLKMALDPIEEHPGTRLVTWIVFGVFALARLSWRFRVLVDLRPESFTVAGPFGRREFRYDKLDKAVCYDGWRHICFSVRGDPFTVWWIDIDRTWLLLEQLEVHGVHVERLRAALST